jgi:DNA anti-recombination protein RmuC
MTDPEDGKEFKEKIRKLTYIRNTMSELEKVKTEVKKNKRKTVQLKKEVLEHSQEAERVYKEATERLNKAEEDLKTAIEEEHAMVADIENRINEICSEKDIFCGVVLSHDDILNIVDMAIKMKENIKIPFKLYFKETE